jgi:hypothetical protein
MIGVGGQAPELHHVLVLVIESEVWSEITYCWHGFQYY